MNRDPHDDSEYVEELYGTARGCLLVTGILGGLAIFGCAYFVCSAILGKC